MARRRRGTISAASTAYLTGPGREDGTITGEPTELLSFASTLATREHDAGRESTYTVRDLMTDKIIGYAKSLLRKNGGPIVEIVRIV